MGDSHRSVGRLRPADGPAQRAPWDPAGASRLDRCERRQISRGGASIALELIDSAIGSAFLFAGFGGTLDHWALGGGALLAAGERGESVDRGVAWLAETQREDGSWEEREFTGTGFPRDFYIRYHLYRQVFPVLALGRYMRGEA